MKNILTNPTMKKYKITEKSVKYHKMSKKDEKHIKCHAEEYAKLSYRDEL